MATLDLEVLDPIASIWPTSASAETWTDSRGFVFKLVHPLWAKLLGWGCTLCMNDEEDTTIRDTDLVFVDADEWPWIDRGQNHPAFMHMRHFTLQEHP